MNAIDFCHVSVCTFVSAQRKGTSYIIHNEKSCIHSDAKYNLRGVRGPGT